MLELLILMQAINSICFYEWRSTSARCMSRNDYDTPLTLTPRCQPLKLKEIKINKYYKTPEKYLDSTDAFEPRLLLSLLTSDGSLYGVGAAIGGMPFTFMLNVTPYFTNF